MTAEVAFDSLGQQVRALGAALTWLRTTVREDAPAPDDLALVETLGDIADDLLGLAAETLIAAESARQAVDPPASLDRAARALVVCQRQINQLARRFAADLSSYEPIADLRRLPRSRGPAWGAWARLVVQAIDECRQPLDDVQQLLLQCWQELTERRAPAVSVQTTNIGQQVTVPAAEIAPVT